MPAVPEISSVAALVFDFDGLILDTEAAEFTSIAAVFAESGSVLDRDRWRSHIGTANPQGFWLDWLEADLGKPVNRDWLWLEQRQRNDLQVARLPVLPGVIELLDSAAAMGIPCAVASSSTGRWVRPHLDRLGLLDRFATVVSREDAEHAKPAPDLYLVALDRLGIPKEEARRAIALEDSRNGSLAAVAAGLTCVVCPNGLTAGMDASHAHHHVSSLTDLTLKDLAKVSTVRQLTSS
jgi:putative hydrolase of the HAD superfamily